MSMHPSFSGVSLGDGGSSNDGGSHNSEIPTLDNVGKTSFGFNFESEMGQGNSSNPSEGGDSDEGNPRQRRAGSSTSSGNRASNESGSNGSEEGASPEASVPSPPSDPMQPSPTKNVKAVPAISMITNANATFGDRSSSEERGGNRSDSSALVNVGKSSFGFNFDSEGGTGNSSNPSEEGDSDEGPNMQQQQQQQQRRGAPLHVPTAVNTSALKAKQSRRAPSASDSSNSLSAPSTRSSLQSSKKRSRSEVQEQSSGGYDTDEDEGRGMGSSHSKQRSNEIESGDMNVISDGKESKGEKSTSSSNDARREERNAREKARSMRIAKKIEEIREVLHQGGVVLPKGTKSTVLSEASRYMRQLQDKHRRLEGERLSLMQQVRMIGGGLMGDAAAAAIRNVAAQSGAFGKAPQTTVPRRTSDEKSNEVNYKLLFDSCTVGMAIAGIGGSIIDCNDLFSEVVAMEKQNVCAMTLFNMTSRQDLHGAFNFMSQILSGPGARRSCVLRAAFSDREDLGLLVTLLDSANDDQKNFCVTLLISATSPFDISNAEPATVSKEDEKKEAESLSGSPAFTAG
eukprot:Nitzschia sp. Nitz4//scaffold288_size23661//20146//22129//NITZ4_008472-RA/size23661-processed-gene-0.42-mRNA-1//1//CDS//3329545806//607//frame0